VTLERGDEDEVVEKVADADFLITARASARVIAAARRLKLIQMPGVGYDTIDIEAARRAGIPVALAPEGTVIGVAEHVVMVILALFRQLRQHESALRRGEWLGWQLRPTSRSLYGKTVGIVGLGRIGREVARRLRPFEVALLYCDAVPALPEVEQELGVQRTHLDDLLARSDVVTLHIPLSSRTRGLIGGRELGLMKRDAILVNTSRGAVVDEAALVEALRTGSIGGAALDVFQQEPLPPGHPLTQLDNVVLTPHSAPGTREIQIEKARASIANMLRVLRGEPLRNQVTG